MKKIIEILKKENNNQSICAVYFKNKTQLSHLKFCKMENNILNGKVVNDDNFFRNIYMNYGITKNQLLLWIDLTIEKKEFIHIDKEKEISIIITKEI